ncbi:MAG: hypothetical protein QOH62_1393 [Solirubrobacteraceae bacterium]|nr:hypothetical protein [Solirubrobacteraceae bacterium]
MRRMRRSILAVLILLAVPASALAETQSQREHDHGAGGVAEARRGHAATKPPDQVAGGAITVEPTEGLASALQTVRVTLAAGAAPVDLAFPARFSQRAINGHAFVKGTPRGRRLDASGRTVSLDVSGLPAGTYRLPVRRGGAVIGTAVFRLYARRREGGDERAATGPFGRLGRVPVDSSNDNTEESEAFIVAEPDNPQRIAAFGNDIDGSGLGGLNISNDGGATWSHPSFPTLFNRTGGVPEVQMPSGDPILAADANGNIWAGGLSKCGAPTSHAQIFVNRLAGPSGTSLQLQNVALPILHGDCNAIQDKPQMTIDNTPASPTYGRLYVVWGDPDPSGATNEVVSYCDTRPGGVLNAAACDSPGNWKAPVAITDAPGSYITSDPAVGPDGKLYVVWWDYSATNAIGIDMCDPVAHAGQCNAAGDWGTDRIVASLTTHSGNLVPFLCPTVAQPGGRAGPVPSVAVDRASGRLYVAWSDLSTTGDSRCTVDPTSGSGRQPSATQDAFHSYVASAPDYATMTANPATPSYARGTNIIGDAGDHWFPWVAVDQSTGQPWVDLYSTRDDATRRTARFYARAVLPAPDSTRVSYGPLTPVSSDATDYSTDPCCQFGNDYGDYEGLDAAGGSVFAAWTHRLAGDDGDVYVNVLSPAISPPEVPGDDAIPVPPPPPPPPPPAPAPKAVVKKPIVKLVSFATRLDRKGRYALKLKAVGEAAAGRATLRIATGNRRKLVSGLLATSGNKPLVLRIKLKATDLAMLKRKHQLKVKLSISLTDVAGHTVSTSKTFTLRPAQ